MVSFLRCLLPLSVLTTACLSERPHDTVPELLDVRRDYHSYSNVRDFRTEHLVLDLAVDFERRVLEGAVELNLQRLDAGAAELRLDTRDLDVAHVETAAGKGDWSPGSFRLDARDAILGSALRIAMPPGANRVRIHYATRPEASGLQWLAAAQTADRRHPFLYSQSQALHARSWIPLQDTPQVRSTYEARIRTSRNLLAAMSACQPPEIKRDGDYFFRMSLPIPSYLIALAVGNLYFQPTGPRTGIYAERSVIEAAADEFEDTEQMLKTSERLMGSYRWGRYDVLVLPPSFPYGGMENPCLTFVSPTSIAGDKSGVSLVAHELAHSWSGNLVTNATWRDFWLNEGLTTHLTHRIMEAIYGKRRSNMERAEGMADLQRALAEAEKPGDRALAVDLRGRNPDDTVTAIPYERGALFLAYLESKFGRTTFDAFLRNWFDNHAFQSKITEDFLAYLDAKLLRAHPGTVPLEKIDEWIYKPELPDDAVLPSSEAFSEIETQRAAWLEGRLALADLPTQNWSVQEWRHFLDLQPDALTREQLVTLDRRFNLTLSHNRFIACDWFKIAIAHNYQAAYRALEQHLRAVGRMRLMVPLYKELAKTEAGLTFARRVYADARPGYHPIAQTAVERVLSVPAR
ncbi:MAG: M1 family metallopeptidase [Nevskiales bacterium]|nr:M1 family metallopeptidase [Nevskiales bacterium]